MVLSLPEIAVHHIQDAWNIIINDLPIDINVRPIIEYFNKIWLDGIIIIIIRALLSSNDDDDDDCKYNRVNHMFVFCL